MAILDSGVDRSSAQFSANEERMLELVRELRERTELVARGGSVEAVERHRARNKLTARERIERLLDPDSAFLELSPLAAWDCYDGEAPSAGIVTGVGSIEGRECVLVVNDATVKGGTYLPLALTRSVVRTTFLGCSY